MTINRQPAHQKRDIMKIQTTNREAKTHHIKVILAFSKQVDTIKVISKEKTTFHLDLGNIHSLARIMTMRSLIIWLTEVVIREDQTGNKMTISEVQIGTEEHEIMTDQDHHLEIFLKETRIKDLITHLEVSSLALANFHQDQTNQWILIRIFQEMIYMIKMARQTWKINHL